MQEGEFKKTQLVSVTDDHDDNLLVGASKITPGRASTVTTRTQNDKRARKLTIVKK